MVKSFEPGSRIHVPHGDFTHVFEVVKSSTQDNMVRVEVKLVESRQAVAHFYDYEALEGNETPGDA